jgi:hypothetical protein
LNRLAVRSYIFSIASFLEVCLWWLQSRSVDIFFRSSAIFCQLYVHGWPNPSGRTMALGSTQPLTEMSTRNL